MIKSLSFREEILPHLISITAFLIIVIIFSSQAIFEGKTLFQHDIYQWKGGAQELLEFRSKTGEEGLWTNSMFSGMPGYLVNLVFSGDLIIYLQKALSLGLPHPAHIIFISFISYYIMLLAFGIRPYLAMAGAIAFGLTSFNIIGISAGHNSRIIAIAFMPLVIAGIHMTLKKDKLW